MGRNNIVGLLAGGLLGFNLITGLFLRRLIR